MPSVSRVVRFDVLSQAKARRLASICAGNAQQQHAAQQHPRHDPRREADGRNQRGSHLERCVGAGVLHGVATLVSSHGCRGDAVALVDALAEVHGLDGGVIVVGQLAIYGGDAHVVDAVLAQHAFGHLAPRQPAGQRAARILLEFAL